MKRARLLLALAVLPSAGSALTLMDFNRNTGPDYVVDSFAHNAFYTTVGGTAMGDGVRITSPSKGGGFIYNTFAESDLSAYLSRPLLLRASVEAGNEMYNFTVILQEAGSDYDYHYSFATSTLGQGAFAWTAGPTLNDPSFVLDRTKGYAYVGSGPAHAPALKRANWIAISSNYAAPSNLANRIVFDELQVVPEPATLAAFGLGALSLLRRKRRFR